MSNPLTAGDQRFLATRYGFGNTARVLVDAGRPNGSCYGGAGGDYWFDTDSRGIGYTRTGETGKPGSMRHAHTITWGQIRAHVQAQPRSVCDELRLALLAHHAEASRHWEAMTAINKEWWRNATDEQKQQLRAEEARHAAADRATSSRLRAAVLAMLPLSTDEPADLIEWAQALS